jgi:hypothetical protein
MAKVEVTVKFDPQTLKSYSRNEIVMNIALENADESKLYWCECEIAVKSPLSLAIDRELDVGRTRMGIVKHDEGKSKQIKLYTRPSNFPDDYKVGITTYVYEDDGTIADRVEQTESIACV